MYPSYPACRADEALACGTSALSDGLGACDIDRLDRFDADDGPLRFATGDFLETGTIVHGLGPEPHVVILGTGRLVDRIGLNQCSALFLGIRNGSREECLCDALAAILGGYNEADD